MAKLFLSKGMFLDHEKIILKHGEIEVSTFRYPQGIEAIRIKNQYGYLVVLPYMGQMIWDAQFCDVNLKMESMFKSPQHGDSILDTYGCYMYHAGVLRNGNPSEGDQHNLHGEFPVATMDSAYIEMLDIEGIKAISIVSLYEYIKGFGDHYLASPHIVFAENKTVFDITMEVKNLASVPMELMYMLHLNNAYEADGTIHQMADFTSKDMVMRQSIPSHVKPKKEWLEFMEQAAADPALTQILNDSEKLNPEIVYFIQNLRTDHNGDTHLLLERTAGDGHYCSYKPDELPFLTRWMLYNGDQKVSAFALPGTCSPDGYTKEKEKGNVMWVRSGETKKFTVTTGYINKDDIQKYKHIIKG